ncbi:melanocyte-stimulating hormone receptor-like [Orbicella faveolata]|uniref:melanocyte-stimulating hormone receptor-like n=1 Tax=Orbicella faveolata TaxID=48498 RepID=UPI0009E4F6D1|nr:melanocyte-stimulating hormone receptor-like [Orbicella faveolata]XP_020620390.1 melanocyte-stimulating hormone receptor-like [Orbicella faveolata]
MANVTKEGNYAITQDYFCTIGLGIHQKIVISALNIPQSISAFLGNVLIIVALQKVSFLHPPSRLLLGCLAVTDLGVGLITQPIRIALFMSPEHSKLCYYLTILFETIGGMFCAVSVLTTTAISVDRLLALMLGLRYRQVVSLRRTSVFVVSLWLFIAAIVIVAFYNFHIALNIAYVILLLCIGTSTFCYMKIYLTLRHRETQVQGEVHQGQLDGQGITLNIARYRKTVSSALWIQMTLLACYLPYSTLTAFIVISGIDKQALNLAWAVTMSLLLLNSSLNPFLYCWKMKEIRQAVKDTVRQFGCLRR